jgi:PTH1 family peptidyl-tRNA hydrolase
MANQLTIIALGNLGAEYQDSRHNYGWMVADRLLEKAKIVGRKNKPSYQTIDATYRGRKLLVCKPLTYMNLSGVALENLIRERNLELKDMIVIYDDLDIAFGEIKMRHGGGDGGHKGIRSIINETGSADFSRMRLGIQPEEKAKDVSEFVLSPFSYKEMELLDKLLDRAAAGALDLCFNPVRIVMNSFNRKKKEEKAEDK